MHIVRFIVITLVCCLSFTIKSSEYKKAFVTLPVINLVGESVAHLFNNNQQIESFYQNIPTSWGPNNADKKICPRIHQLLFNEAVLILQENTYEALVEIPNIFLHDHNNSQPSACHFWTLKKYLCGFEQLKVQGFLPQQCIPEPISYQNPWPFDNYVVTLQYPFYDPITQQTYSAGTRFILISSDIINKQYKVLVYWRTQEALIPIVLPYSKCFIGLQNTSLKKRLLLFVETLRQWAHPFDGVIPLCFGGNSYTQVKTGSFILMSKIINNEKLYYWQTTGNSTPPFTGFDASGLVLRASQLCGIPYFCKNSSTAAKSLPRIPSLHALQEGDLLWVPGGLFVVSSLDKNLLIGVLSYQFGYGKVVELSVSQLFENVNSFEDLFYAYHNKLPLQQKDRSGATVRTVNDYAFLTLKNS